MKYVLDNSTPLSLQFEPIQAEYLLHRAQSGFRKSLRSVELCVACFVCGVMPSCLAILSMALTYHSRYLPLLKHTSDDMM